jgi:hypothetical protein
VSVLAPSGAVLWFMTDAARSQAESARQKVAEAYRGQLGLLRERVDEWWRERAAALADSGATSPSGFLPAVKAAGADAPISLDDRGRIGAQRNQRSAAGAWVRLLRCGRRWLTKSERDPDLAARAGRRD